MLYKLIFPAQAAGSNKVYWSGLRVVQGSVASVGNIAFDMILRVERQQ